MAQPDFVIAGAGIIGLSLALELEGRGASVLVIDAGNAMQQTSSAAAGMLAVEDPANPAALYPLSALSASLYPAFLDRIESLSGQRVPFQTYATLDSHPGPNPLANPHELVPQLGPDCPAFSLLDERSVDPRQLATALLAAVRATRIELREQTALQRIRSTAEAIHVETSGQPITAPYLIDCMGTWSPAPVSPRKGQMLAVQLPFELTTTIRTPDVYIVPRTEDPNAGRAIIGATIEDAGFNLTVHPSDILKLNAKAVALLPALAEAAFLESWSGLRPSTADGLPFLGPTQRQPRYVLATGHFRNGILLAPATAHVLGQMLFHEPPSTDLSPYSPSRNG